jgi:hypothetical protein
MSIEALKRNLPRFELDEVRALAREHYARNSGDSLLNSINRPQIGHSRVKYTVLRIDRFDPGVALAEEFGGRLEVELAGNRYERKHGMHRERGHAQQQAAGNAHGKAPVLEIVDALLLRMAGERVHRQGEIRSSGRRCYRFPEPALEAASWLRTPVNLVR